MAKYLSIRQPFAWAVIHGHKVVENRTWETNHRGFLWIHAGKSKEAFAGSDPEDWHEEGGLPFVPDCPPWKELALGAIVGAVDMVDCVSEAEARRRLGPNPHIFGPICFLFENPRVLKVPVPLVGNVGIRPVELEPADEMFLPSQRTGTQKR